MDHVLCTWPHRRTVPAHCGPCGGPWPCRGALLVEAERLRTELVDAAVVRLDLEDQLTTARMELAAVEEEVAGLRLWTPVDQAGAGDG